MKSNMSNDSWGHASTEVCVNFIIGVSLMERGIVQLLFLMCSESLPLNILKISKFSWYFMLVLQYDIVITYLFESLKITSLSFFSFNF